MHVSLQLATLDKFIPAAANLYKIRVFHAQQPGSSLLQFVSLSIASANKLLLGSFDGKIPFFATCNTKSNFEFAHSLG